MRRLLIRPGALGDFVVSLPALEWLRADDTEVWTSAANAPLVLFADRACSIESTGLDLLELGLAPPPLRPRLAAFDEIVSWYGSTREEFRAAVHGLPFRFLPALPSGAAHAVDYYLEQVGAPPGASPRIDAGPVARGGYAVFHPFSGSARKNWPLDRFRAVAERLPIPVRWCAGPDETLDGAQRFHSRLDLARFLAGARVYLGNDSGPSHLAAAAGAPTVALFGPTDPAIWAPRGVRARVVAAASLDAITVEQVTSAVLECL